MKTSFIVICDDLNNVKMPITPVVGFFAILGYQMDNIKLITTDFLEQQLTELMMDKSVIFVPFDNQECLARVKSVLDTYVQATVYTRREFGYIAQNSDKICFIINIGLGDGVVDALRSENDRGNLPANGGVNFKLFVEEGVSEIINISECLSDSVGADFTYNYDCGDMLLHFGCDSGESSLIEQQVYSALGDKIYIDDSISIDEALLELMTVQRRRLLILDYAGCDFLKTGLDNFVSKGIVEFLEKREFKNLDKARQYIFDNKFDILMVVSRNSEGFVLAFIDEIKSKNVQISFKSFQKYGVKGLFYLILYNILEKFRKNTW